MFEQYPNPIRLFSSNRDEFFLELLEALNIPISLFSDIRDSQVPQLSATLEEARIKNGKAKGENADFSLYQRGTLESFLPRFGLSKLIRELFADHGITADDFSSLVESENVLKFEGELARSTEDWINVIPRERMIQSYINLAEIFFELFASLKEKLEIDFSSLEELKDKLKEDNELLAQMLFDTIDLDIYKSFVEDSWKEGENDILLIPVADAEAEEDDKPKVKELSHGEFRGRSNVLYSLALEFVAYARDSSSYPVLEKDEDDKYITSKDIIPGTENMDELLTIESLLYNPHPKSLSITIAQGHVRSLSKLISEIPPAFWEILLRNFHVIATGIVRGSPKYKALEKYYRNQVTEFWKSVGDEKEALKLTSAIWMQLLHIRTLVEHEQTHEDHKQLFKSTISTLEKEFWKGSRSYLGNELDTPLQFWSKFASIDNMDTRNSSESGRVFSLYQKLIESVEIDSPDVCDTLDITLVDKHMIYKRMAFVGVQSAKAEIRDNLVSVMEKLDDVLEKIESEGVKFPGRVNIDDEKRVAKSLRDSLSVFDTRIQEVESTSRRR